MSKTKIPQLSQKGAIKGDAVAGLMQVSTISSVWSKKTDYTMYLVKIQEVVCVSLSKSLNGVYRYCYKCCLDNHREHLLVSYHTLPFVDCSIVLIFCTR